MKKIYLAALAISALASANAQTPSLGMMSANPFAASTKMNKQAEGSGTKTFGQGTIAINLGYGWPNLAKTTLKLVDDEANYKATGIGPIAFRFEYGLNDKIGLGVSVNYSDAGAEWTDTNGNNGISYNYSVKRSTLSILPRFNIHFATSDKVDPYFGLAVGFRTTNWKFETNDPSADEAEYIDIPNLVPVGFEAVVGVRVYFTENIGAYTEIGISKGVMQAGLALKF